MKITLSEHFCAKLYVASRLMVQAYGPELKSIDLTYPKYLVLLALEEENGLTVKELGEKLSLDSGTLSPLLKSLSKQHYVERKRSQKDDRVVGNYITTEGMKACQEGQAIALKLFDCTGLTVAAIRTRRSDMDDFISRCKNILNGQSVSKELVKTKNSMKRKKKKESPWQSSLSH